MKTGVGTIKQRDLDDESFVVGELAHVELVFRALRNHCDELERRIALAVIMIDAQHRGIVADFWLMQLRAVLADGTRPDLEPENTDFPVNDYESDEPDPWADGTMRQGMRGFTGGKP